MAHTVDNYIYLFYLLHILFNHKLLCGWPASTKLYPVILVIVEMPLEGTLFINIIQLQEFGDFLSLSGKYLDGNGQQFIV